MTGGAATPPVVAAGRSRRPPWLGLALWLLLYAASLSLYNYHYHRTQEVLIRRMQVNPSLALLQRTLPGERLDATATSIRSSTLEVQILRGCDGVEAWLLLATALLVFPMPWPHRLQGILLGTVLVWSLNIARIVSLFHIALRRPAWLDLAHGLIWQTIVVLAAAAFVLVWTAPRSPTEPGRAHGG
jgi:exosortase family protein XrtM